MRAILLGILTMSAGFAQGEEAAWTPMNGAQITQALTDRSVQYENAWQQFNASGRTLYNAGRDSWGYWGVRGDQYCSLWPPSDLWACYEMAQRGDMLRFIGQAGDITDATYRN